MGIILAIIAIFIIIGIISAFWETIKQLLGMLLIVIGMLLLVILILTICFIITMIFDTGVEVGRALMWGTLLMLFLSFFNFNNRSEEE